MMRLQCISTALALAMAWEPPKNWNLIYYGSGKSFPPDLCLNISPDQAVPATLEDCDYHLGTGQSFALGGNSPHYSFQAGFSSPQNEGYEGPVKFSTNLCIDWSDYETITLAQCEYDSPTQGFASIGSKGLNPIGKDNALLCFMPDCEKAGCPVRVGPCDGSGFNYCNMKQQGDGKPQGCGFDTESIVV